MKLHRHFSHEEAVGLRYEEAGVRRKRHPWRNLSFFITEYTEKSTEITERAVEQRHVGLTGVWEFGRGLGKGDALLSDCLGPFLNGFFLRAPSLSSLLRVKTSYGPLLALCTIAVRRTQE